MKLKLKDVETNTHQATIGSCDLCMSIETVNEPVFVFELPDKSTKRVKAYYWEWGHYGEVLVDNVIDFADYIRNQEFDKEVPLNYNWLQDTIWDYEEHLRKQQEGV